MDVLPATRLEPPKPCFAQTIEQVFDEGLLGKPTLKFLPGVAGEIGIEGK
jgi:hypothetical protein